MPEGGINVEFGSEMRPEQCVRIPIVNDSDMEQLESFKVALTIPESADSAVVLLTNPQKTIVGIIDDGE